LNELLTVSESTDDPQTQENATYARLVLEHFAQNLEQTLQRLKQSRYNISRLPKSVLLTHYLLTSPELGYRKVQIEPMIGPEKQVVDIYVDDIGLAIDLDGPVHFTGNTGERIVKLLDRKRERSVNLLRVKYDIFDKFLAGSVDFAAF